MGLDGIGMFQTRKGAPHLSPVEGYDSPAIAGLQHGTPLDLDNLGEGGYPSWVDRSSPASQRTLPTDPAELKGMLVAEFAPLQKEKEYSRSVDDDIYDWLGEILRQNTAPPAVRGAMLEVIRGLDGIRFDADVRDSLNRRSVLVGRAWDRDPSSTTEMLFDARTTQLIEVRHVSLPVPGRPPVTITGTEALIRTAVVPGVGEPPPVDGE